MLVHYLLLDQQVSENAGYKRF